MTETQIIKDFDSFEVQDTVAGFGTKKALLQDYIDELAIYRDLLGVDLQFAVGTQAVGLSSQLNEIANLNKELMQVSVYKSLYQLKEAGLIDDTDISAVQGKFVLDEQKSCGNFHGNYQIREDFVNGHHHGFEVTAIPLNINVCGNYFLLRDLVHHYQKIIIHEMAHHFYYVHDKEGNKDFERICRNGNQRKSVCSNGDFVTDYAMSHGVEDYAEHFMHRFLDIVPRDTEILRQKTAHFEAFK